MLGWVLILGCTDPVRDADPLLVEAAPRTVRAGQARPTPQSRVDPAPLTPAGGQGKLVPQRTLVVGGGPAGLAAAIDLEGPVVLLEATDHLGGRGALSGGLSLYLGTEELAALGLTGTASELAADWEQLTGAPATAATVAWLEQGTAVHDRLVGLGVDWTIGRADPILGRWWLHQPEGSGVAITNALAAALPAEVDVRLDTVVTGLRFVDGKVAGVDTEAGPILADTVVIATGGFVNRIDLLDYAIDDASGTFEVSTDEFAMGDALDWAARFGLGTANLDAIGWSAGLVGAPGADGTPIRIETGSVTPWIWIDESGSRFVDESQGWSVLLAGSERRRTNVWAVGSYEHWVAGLEEPDDGPAMDLLRSAGDVIRCDNDPGVLAGLLGVEEAGLRATLVDVGEIVAGTRTDVWLRRGSTFPTTPGTLCAYRIGHQSMKGYGGLAVTGDGRVMDVEGQVIPGLWSVGEAAGMAVPGMGGTAGWDGSMSAVVWGGFRAAAAINAGR